MMRWIAAAIVSGAPVLAAAETVAPADVTYDDYGSVEQSLTGTAGDAAFRRRADARQACPGTPDPPRWACRIDSE